MSKENDNYNRLSALGIFSVCKSPGRTHRSKVFGYMDLFAERLSVNSTCKENGQYHAALLAHYVTQTNGVLQGNPEILLRIYTDKKITVPYQLNLLAKDDLLDGIDSSQSTQDMTAYLSHWLDDLDRAGHGSEWDC